MQEMINPRSDGVRLFLRRWYGPGGGRGNLLAPPARGVPHELAEWHKEASSVGSPVTFQDYPVPLSELTRSEDGMMVFWIENQGAYYWAVDPDEDDSVVVVREYGSDPWLTTGETLGRFLLHCTVREAIVGAESKLAAVVPESVLHGQVLTRLIPLGFPAMATESSSTRLFCRHDALVMVMPPPVGYSLPGESSWMAVVAVAHGQDVRKVDLGLADFVLSGEARVEPVDAFEEPPF
ncbi:hypothetical protein [Polymorphospora rubra]|uniref:hypothetical protein n=1 Tax=Polymorphospora rubra TaxID=338584 RepID=UPI001BB2F95D|nr:hypothetical protein [Polymorphospora rubra]